jgi:hypothetical protein
MLQAAALFLLLQAAEFGTLAYPRFPPDRDRSEDGAQQFRETRYRQFQVGELATS